MKALWFFLLVGYSICVAQVCYAQDTSNQISVAPASQDGTILSAPVAGSAMDRLIFNLKADSTDNFCAYMRTYRVKRRWPGSDAVAPAGYATCVPTRRFEVRSAVECHTDSRDTRKNSGQE